MNKKQSNLNRSFATDAWFRLRRNKSAMIALAFIVLIVLLATFADVLADYDTLVIGSNAAERLQGPSFKHLFGTDDMGRDLFARVIHGARYSLTFGLFGSLIVILIGTAVGGASAFFGGKVDAVITFCLDSIHCIPHIMLSLSMMAVLGPGMTNLMIAITVSAAPGVARIIRSIVLDIVKQDYIEAARACGVSSARIIAVHVLPNAIGQIIVNATMEISSLIMSAASLSFIGMGIQPPDPEWGAMLSNSLQFLRTYPHVVIFPGMAIVLTALSFNLLGDGLSEALDPRMKD